MQKPADPPSTTEPARPSVLLPIVALGVTQMIGWGTSFSTLTIYGNRIGQDLGLSRELVFGGITVLLIVSALVAAPLGRYVDRYGARPIMMAGSAIAGLSMLLMAFAESTWTYALAWALFGLATPMMLSNAALPGLVQIIGPNARRAITGLTLITGLTSTVFLPIHTLLLATTGWRGAYLIFAALHLLVCLPVHALILRSARSSRRPIVRATGSTLLEAGLPPELRFRAFVLLAVWICSEGLITWGLYIQIIDILKGLGLTAVQGVLVWSLVGPAQALARLSELVFGGRYSILTTAKASAVFTTVSFFFIMLLDVSLVTASLFAVSIGLGHGLFAVARNTLPLQLFGVAEYGAYMGRLMVPQSIVNAGAPIIFAAAISRFDAFAPLWIAASAAALGFVSVLVLVRSVRHTMPDEPR